MFTDPQIVTPNSPGGRAYVKVYINGTRHRFYNGKELGINCNPNHCKSLKERHRALSKICFTLRKKLESGWLPSDQKQESMKQVPSTSESLSAQLKELDGQDLSDL